MLWTNDPLTAARALYAALGFRLVSSEPVVAFGKPMASEIWSLDLRASSPDMEPVRVT
jgi:hypothetical protein